MNLKNLQLQRPFEEKVKISSGAFGDVYMLGPKGNSQKCFAAKMINMRNLLDSGLPINELEENLKKEINILESLSKEVFKPQCFPIYYNYKREESIAKDITYIIFFQYYPFSLSGLIEEKKEKQMSFETKTVHQYFMSLLNCLSFLQLMGICHRDLKPQNILLDETQQNLILIDFGISENVARKLQNLNTTRIQMPLGGTKHYLSPEMLKEFVNANQDVIQINPFKADVFSFGIIFLELLLLKRLRNSLNHLQQSKEKMFQKLQNMKEHVDNRKEFEKIMNILVLCLEEDPKNRPDFVTLFLKCLELKQGKRFAISHFN